MVTRVYSRLVPIFLAVLAFFLPLTFLPFFSDPYDFGKAVFLLTGLFLTFAIWMGQAIMEKKLIFKKSHYLLPVLLLSGLFIASALINSPYRTQSFVAPVGAGAIVIGALAYLLFNNLAKKRYILYALLGSGTILSLLRLLFFLKVFNLPLALPSLNLSIGPNWSPTGSLIALSVFLLVLIPTGFSLIYDEIKKSHLPMASILFVANTLNLIGLGLSFHLLSTSAKPVLLPQSTAWTIALESLKDGRLALLGIGPGQYINAFTAFKPMGFNLSEYWNLRFATASNWYYQLLTEVGILGLLTYLFLGWKIIRDGIKVFRQPRLSHTGLAIYLSLILLLLVQLFVPLNFFLLTLMFIFLAISQNEEPRKADLAPFGKLVFLLLFFPLAFWGGIFLFTGKVALADWHFLASLKAAAQDDGVATYNRQIRAIQANPNSANYRIAYSQTNFALANNLAAKEGMTDQDRQTITQLIQQAIREAKAAVALNPKSAIAWENLANLYRNLINFAEGSDQWALASYQQAINLDPLNPRLRVDLGGLYYSTQNWQQAANFFAQAINLKPDWANAHYNLANSLRELGDFNGAAYEYQLTQSLVSVDSNDYQKVTAELEEVKKRIPSPTPVPVAQKTSIVPETLQTPPEPAEGINPPLELPEEGPAIE